MPDANPPPSERTLAELIDGLQAEDGAVAPHAHAALLKAHQPELAARLLASDVASVANRYERADREALSAQSALRRSVHWANLAIAAAAVANGLLLGLAAGSAKGDALPVKAVFVLGVSGVVAGAAGAMLLGLARQGGWLGRWMRQRGDAELQRRRYFETILRKLPATALPSFVEYFRRFQIDDQLKYHDARASSHGRKARVLLILGAVASLVAAVASGLGGLLAVSDPRQAAWAAFGVIGGAVGAYAASAAAMGQFQSIRDLHEEGWRLLIDLRGRLDEVRAGAKAGDASVVENFLTAVHEAMKSENERWLEAEQRMRAAAEQLEEALKRTDSEKGEHPRLPAPARAGGAASGTGHGVEAQSR
jgi:hypothetical protein